MHVVPQNNHPITTVDQVKIKTYSALVPCLFFIISTLIFAFQNPTARAFGGLFFGIGLLLIVIGVVITFCCPSCSILPKKFQKRRQIAVAIISLFITDMLAAIDSQAHSEVVKTLQALSFIFAIISFSYAIVVISYKEIVLRQAQNRIGGQGINEQFSMNHINPIDGPTDCSICISIIRSIDRHIRLGCGHKFHDVCFQGWNRRRCPNCNGPF